MIACHYESFKNRLSREVVALLNRKSTSKTYDKINTPYKSARQITFSSLSFN